MSYTTFSYRALKVHKQDRGVRVDAMIENTGDRAGDEVVQLYVDFPNTFVERPAPLLKGFARVSLSPGDRKRVSLFIPYEDLKYWDIGVSDWRIEPGRHKFALSPDSSLKNAIWGSCQI